MPPRQPIPTPTKGEARPDPLAWSAQAKGKRSAARLGVGTYAAGAEPSGGLEGVSREQRTVLWARLPAVGLLVACLWVVSILFAHPRFRVTEVRIVGAKLLREADVERALNVMDMSIFRVQPTELAARLQCEFACLERVTVRCQLPNKLTVTLEERAAVSLWESGGRYWWVAADGRVLGLAAQGARPSTAQELVIVHNVQGFASEPQEYIVGVPWKLAHEMVKALPAIKSFEYASDKGLILYVTAATWPVYMGHKGDGPTKVAIMRALVDQLVASKVDIEYIDLRNEQRPVFKKR